MKRYSQKLIIPFFLSSKKNYFIFHVSYYVIMFLLCFIALAVFLFLFFNLIKITQCSLIEINWNAQ